jgi:hypothetical protein
MWPTYPTIQLIARLNALKAAFYKGTPDFSVLKLFANDITPDANSVASMFTVPTFTGYADVNLTMTTASLNDANIPVSQSNLCHFQPTADGSTDIIYGVFIVDSTGLLIAAERFTNPIPVPTTLNAIAGVWRVSEPLSNYGWLSTE